MVKEKFEQVIQGYHMVSGTHTLLIIFESYTEGSRAADPKGTKSCRTQGRISIRPSVHPSIHQSPPTKLGLQGPELGP